MAMKRIVFSFTALCLFTAVASSAFASVFKDVSQSHPNSLAVEYLSETEVIQGQGNGERFVPNGYLNRAEWAAILHRYAGVSESIVASRNCFPDVRDEWFAKAVCRAAREGWVKGYQAGEQRGRFLPSNLLTKAELLVTLERLFDWSGVEGSSWYSIAASFASRANISTESALHEPVSRAVAVELLFRSHALQHYSVPRYDPFLGEQLLSELHNPSPAEVDGMANDLATDYRNVGAEVGLVPFGDMPASKNIARGGQYVPMLRFELQPNAAVTLNKVEIKSINLGRTQDIERARLLMNGRPIGERSFLGSTRAVSWDQLQVPLNPQSPALFEMMLDFKADAPSHYIYQLSIEPSGLGFKERDVQVTGAAVLGKSFEMSEVSMTAVTVSNSSSRVRAPFISSEGEIIGRFVIHAGQHDVLIKRLRLRDRGTIRSDDYHNFRLTVGNDTLSELATVERGIFDFLVNDYLVEKNRRKIFTVFADIKDANTRDNIRLTLENPEDLYAYNIEFGMGSQVTNNFGSDVAWCVGVESKVCPAIALKKRCDRFQREYDDECGGEND